MTCLFMQFQLKCQIQYIVDKRFTFCCPNNFLMIFLRFYRFLFKNRAPQSMSHKLWNSPLVLCLIFVPPRLLGRIRNISLLQFSPPPYSITYCLCQGNNMDKHISGIVEGGGKDLSPVTLHLVNVCMFCMDGLFFGHLNCFKKCIT